MENGDADTFAKMSSALGWGLVGGGDKGDLDRDAKLWELLISFSVWTLSLKSF